MIAMGNLKSGLSLFYLHFLTHGYLSVKVATTPSNCDATEVTPSSISMKKKRNEKSWGHQSIATKPSGKTTNTRPGPAVTKSLMGTPVMCWNVKLKDIKTPDCVRPISNTNTNTCFAKRSIPIPIPIPLFSLRSIPISMPIFAQSLIPQH